MTAAIGARPASYAVQADALAQQTPCPHCGRPMRGNVHRTFPLGTLVLVRDCPEDGTRLEPSELGVTSMGELIEG